MEKAGYNELIGEIEEFLEENQQTLQARATEIEATLKKLGLFVFPYYNLFENKERAAVWWRVLQRMDIPREERIHGVLGAILATAYERNKKTIKEDKNGKG